MNIFMTFDLVLRRIMLFLMTSSKTAILTNMCICESAAKAYFSQDNYDPGQDVIVVIMREVPVPGGSGIFPIMSVRWRVRHGQYCIDSMQPKTTVGFLILSAAALALDPIQS